MAAFWQPTADLGLLWWVKASGVGFVSGVLSGMFGIGGGLVTTPAIRLLLGGSALSAVATPLPVIVPTAIAGASSYVRHDLADVPAGLQLGGWGALSAVAGALLATRVGGGPLLVITAIVLAVAAFDMIRQAQQTPVAAEGSVRVVEGDAARGIPTPESLPRFRTSVPALAAAGIATGLYSGLLGLGGGFVLVPLLIRAFGFPPKRAIGTSLVAIAILAVPGTLTHLAVGNIDVPLALALSLTVIPGSLVGARVTRAASDRAVRLGFAGLLVFAAVMMAANELVFVR